MRCSASFLLGLTALGACAAARGQTPGYSNVGRTPTQEEIRAWDIAVSPGGKELPPGSGTAKQGEKIYAQKCASCHGPTATENRLAPRMVGGEGSLVTEHPVKTVGSYWPYATTLWDYINRAMPWYAEGSLIPDEVYSSTAFLLYKNGIIQENDVLDDKTLPKVQMPNRNGFVPPKPEWKKTGSK
jgi:hypothetical protein